MSSSTARRRERKTAIDRRLDELDEKIAQEKRDREAQGAEDDEELHNLSKQQVEFAAEQADLQRRVQRLEERGPFRPGRPRKAPKN